MLTTHTRPVLAAVLLFPADTAIGEQQRPWHTYNCGGAGGTIQSLKQNSSARKRIGAQGSTLLTCKQLVTKPSSFLLPVGPLQDIHFYIDVGSLAPSTTLRIETFICPPPRKRPLTQGIPPRQISYLVLLLRLLYL